MAGDADCGEPPGDFLRPVVAGLVAVEGDEASLDAVRDEGVEVVVGEVLGAPGAGRVAEAAAPRAEEVDRGLAEDDLPRGEEGFGVEETAQRPREVEVIGSAGPQVVADLPAVAVEDLAGRAEDRQGQAAPKMLMASLLPKPAARLTALLELRREFHAERAVGEAELKALDDLRRGDAALLEIGV